MLDQSPTVEPLEDKWSRIEFIQRLIDGFTPLHVGSVASDRDAPTAPGALVESAQLEHQIALGLRKLLHLREVLDAQPGDYGVIRDFCRVNNPLIGKISRNRRQFPSRNSRRQTSFSG